MKHRQISRLLLTAGGIAFVGAAFLMFVYAPILGQDCAAMYPELSYLYWPMLIGVWALGLVYLAAVALLAYCLSALLHHAVQLQEDSDLTV